MDKSGKQYAELILLEAMENQHILNTDLQKFVEKFQPNKFKVLTDRIEIRGLNNIHRGVAQANDLIQKLKLKLKVHHSAEMASYGGMEIMVA